MTKKSFLLNLLLLLTATSFVQATTWYVRDDGGSFSQCSGKADQPYPGSGTGLNCAVKNIMELLPPQGARIAASDTVLIDNVSHLKSGQAQYEISFNAAPQTGNCYFANARYGCMPADIPAGASAAQPTRILGKNFASCDNLNPNQKAQLWGNLSVDHLIGLSSNVEVQCLELTDHTSLTVYNGIKDISMADRDCSDGSCNAGAVHGISGAGNTAVLLKNIDIHGLYTGFFIRRAGNFTIQGTRVVANSLDGWLADDCQEGDRRNCPDSPFTGTITMKDSKIMWSGCEEKYPLTTQDITSSTDKQYCKNGSHNSGWGATNGDAVDFPDASTIGNWNFENVDMSFNMADGLDLLHGAGTKGEQIVIKRSRFEGNDGNAIKVSGGNLTMENSKVIGNCGFFYGQPFTSAYRTDGTHIDPWDTQPCRGNGAAFSLAIGNGGKVHRLLNNTILSETDAMIVSGGTNCSASDQIVLTNNILMGGRDFTDDSSYPHSRGGDGMTDIYYAQGNPVSSDGNCAGFPITGTNNIVWNMNGGAGLNGRAEKLTNTKYIDPQFVGTIPMGPKTYYRGLQADVRLKASSPAVGYGSTSAPLSQAVDYNNWPRGNAWDAGAYEADTQGGSGGGGSGGGGGGLVCGNRVIEGSEQCDDGNLTNGDGCSSTCMKETPKPVCGNKILEGSEQCDDGNTANGDGCSSACLRESPPLMSGSDVIDNFSTSRTFTDGMQFGTCNALTAEISGSPTLAITNNRYLLATSPAKTDGFIIRSTKALPSTYKVAVDIGDIEFDLTNANDEENGFYLPTITSAPGSPTTNDWWHSNRKVHLDIDNNVWGAGGQHPIFMGYYNPSSVTSPDPSDEQLVYDQSTRTWVKINANWASAFNYQKNTWYTFEIEKTASTYFFRIYNAFSHALLQEASVPVSSVRTGSDYLAIGDPHTNYYNGNVKMSNLRISNISCSATSAPTITTQPQNVSVTIGQNASFSVAATGNPSPTYQWQSKTSGATAFSNLTGATAASYTLTNAQMANSGTQFRALVSNSAGSVASNAATLTVVGSVPSITTQPKNASIQAGQNVSFTVTATGTPAPRYTWQSKAPGASLFSNISGATSATYSLSAVPATMNGTQFRVIATNIAGNAISNAATLTVTTTPSCRPRALVSGSASPTNVTPGGKYQIRCDYGVITNSIFPADANCVYTAWSGTTALFDCTAPTTPGSVPLTCEIENISPDFYCGHTDPINSIMVGSVPTITAQPRSVSIQSGQSATFSVTATGSPAPRFTWQSKPLRSALYSNIPGATSPSYTINNVTTDSNGTQFRVIVTNTFGNVISNPVALNVSAACKPRNFVSGSVSPTTVSPGAAYQMRCDYGVVANSIVPTPGSGSCSWTNFENGGTVAVFACRAGTTLGTVPNYCEMKSIAPDYYCEHTDRVQDLRIAGLVSNTVEPEIMLPAPILNPPTTLPLNASIHVSYPGGYSVNTFKWSFTHQGAGAISNSSAPSSPAADLQPNTFTTPGIQADLALHQLKPGYYLVTVYAMDDQNHVSQPAQAYVSLVAADLVNIRVYPNPWKGNKHSGSPITFDNVPLNSTLKIFTISGHLVKTLPVGSATISWDLLTDSGDWAASGVYLYTITLSDSKKQGKFAIVK